MESKSDTGPRLESSEEVKPVEVIRSDTNCPNPRPIRVLFDQNSSKFTIVALKPRPET